MLRKSKKFLHFLIITIDVRILKRLIPKKTNHFQVLIFFYFIFSMILLLGGIIYDQNFNKNALGYVEKLLQSGR